MTSLDEEFSAIFSLPRLTNGRRLRSGPTEPLTPPGSALTPQVMENKVNVMAAHMFKQMKEHESALSNTKQVFETLLNDLDALCHCFQESFSVREIPTHQVFLEIDPDRSVAILHILWHAISFTTRGNTKPLALFRPGRPPQFTGRILAIHGDFRQLSYQVQNLDFPALLEHEVASLYVPGEDPAPAVMTVRHLGEEEHYFHQADAARLFLLKTVEMICGGGFLHEKWL
ncbi:MAG: hypothetical protein SFZ03_00850 [Candidatus Melainabacteria bacterium]|nr:hypothetical protein [Candidatus Melainabacteria bacterium]